MAALAKVFGAFCLVAALGVAAAGVYLFGSIEWESLDASEEDLAFFSLLSVGVWSVLLAAVGAGAYVVGDISELAARDRWERAQRPPDRPYGATSR